MPPPSWAPVTSWSAVTSVPSSGSAPAARITMVPILFDDCDYPGPQDEPKPGSAQQPLDAEPRLAPPPTTRRAGPQLEAYVSGVVGDCGSDRRVLVWDLHNEPGADRPKEGLPLVEAAFRRARAADQQ